MHRLLQRGALESSVGPIYLWADSSPQLGVDCLLSIYDSIAVDRVVSCWQAANTLLESVAAFKEILPADGEMGHGLLEDVVKSRCEANAVVLAHFVRHKQIPMALGSGQVTMPDKAKALAMKFAHETYGKTSLERVASRVYSLTVDMSTESGLSEAAGNISDYLPPWMQPETLLPDDGLEVPAAALPPQSHVFAHAVVSAGLDHISNNVQADLDNHLQGWSEWLTGFRVIANLLSHRHLLKRLVARCVLGGPYAVLGKCFETAVPSISKWRWGTIVKALPPILALHKPLSIVWNASKFFGGQRRSRPGPWQWGCFRLQKVDRNPRGSFMVAIWSHGAAAPQDWDFHFCLGLWVSLLYPRTIESACLLMHFRGVCISGRVRLYFELMLCALQDWLLPSNTDSSAATPEARAVTACLESLGLPDNADGAKFNCPLAGKRAPELAQGVLKTRLRDFSEKLRPDVLMEAATISEASQREKLLNDFELGVSYIEMSLEVKLGQWSDFPWVLCSLSTPAATGRSLAARNVLDAFSKLPQQQEMHHRITWRFLEPGSLLRQQLQRMADDGQLSMEDIHELQYEIACLRFIPVVERVVEAEHSLVHRHGGYRKVTGAYISCSERLGEIDILMNDEQGKRKLLQSFTQCRKLRRLAKLFRFAKHPQWLMVVSKPKREQSGLEKLANAICMATTRMCSIWISQAPSAQPYGEARAEET